MIECIKYIKLNQHCSLAEATAIVVNSQAWADRKEDFLRQQDEAFEEFLADNQDRNVKRDGKEATAVVSDNLPRRT